MNPEAPKLRLTLAGLAGQRDGGVFDGKVTQVKRLANGQKTNNQQPTNLPRQWGIDGILHRALVIGHRSDLSKDRTFPRRCLPYCGMQAQAPISLSHNVMILACRLFSISLKSFIIRIHNAVAILPARSNSAFPEGDARI